MVLPVKVYGDPVLRKEAEKITNFDGELRKLANRMVETMYAAPGIGLAAPQVGVSKRLIVVDISHEGQKDRLYKVVNPEIVMVSDDTDKAEEGCLSIPGIYESVVRPVAAKIKGQDLEGQEISIDAEGLLARCFLHEIDHLNGVLFVDRIVAFRKKLIQHKLKKLFGTISNPLVKV